MFKKIFILLCTGMCFCAFADDEVTIKATGEFAKELKELAEKYRASDINGSIEIVEQNLSLQDELSNISPIEKAMQDEITLDKDSSANSSREVYDQYFSDEKEKKSGGLLDILFDDGKVAGGDVSEGKKLYNNKCARCHGEKAEKSSYVDARNLITLSKDTIVEQLRGYKRDSDYGKNTGLIMRAEALSISDKQMKDVAAYIETLKNHK
jgi:cytochrome c553